MRDRVRSCSCLAYCYPDLALDKWKKMADGWMDGIPANIWL